MRWLITLGLAALTLVALLWLFQRQLIYQPSRTVPEPPQGVIEVSFPTEDGLTLRAWLVKADAHSERGTIVVFNGNAGNRSNRVLLAMALSNEGFSVLLTDYRGYGANPGSPSESGLAADARAAVSYLRGRDDVDSGRIAYFGESLGAGVAIGLAVEEPPAALVLRSPFPSLSEVAVVHYPFLPVSLLLRDRYPNLERISRLDVPVLVIIGSSDRIVPPGLSRELYEAAGEPKQLMVVDGAGHNDLELLAGDEMIAGIVTFLEEALPPE